MPCSRPHQQGQLSSHSCLQEEKRKVACFAELGRTAQTQQSRDRSRELQSPEPVSTCCPVAGLLTRRLTPVCLTPYRTASPASFPTAPLTESQLLFPVSVREAELPSGRAVGKENTKIPTAPDQWRQRHRRQEGVTKTAKMMSYLLCLYVP